MTPRDLKSAREALGLSQAGFARLLGLDGRDADDTVRRWEAGRSRVPGSVAALLWLLDRLPQARALLDERQDSLRISADKD